MVIQAVDDERQVEAVRAVGGGPRHAVRVTVGPVAGELGVLGDARLVGIKITAQFRGASTEHVITGGAERDVGSGRAYGDAAEHQERGNN